MISSGFDGRYIYFRYKALSDGVGIDDTKVLRLENVRVLRNFVHDTSRG